MTHTPSAEMLALADEIRSGALAIIHCHERLGAIDADERQRNLIERALRLAAQSQSAPEANATGDDLPAIPDDDKDFTPDLARKIIAIYQKRLRQRAAPIAGQEPVAYRFKDHGNTKWAYREEPCETEHLVIEPLYTAPPSLDREAIAQALLDRFIDRSARRGRTIFPRGQKIQTLVASYKDDFLADADATLSLTTGAGQTRAEIIEALEKISGRRDYSKEDHEAAARYKPEEGSWTTDEYLADRALGADAGRKES